jgi:Dolichyl-phosphate-mannose-protein mannosyltransferase
MDTTLAAVENRETPYPVTSENARFVSLLSVRYLSLLACVGLSITLVIAFFLFIKPLVTLPADILMWEETNFVGDIIKLRIGAPIYTTPSDNNSLVYTPLAPLLTYAISWLIRLPTSILVWRLIQLGFVTCATLLATACSRSLRRLVAPEQRLEFSRTWTVITLLSLFLAATAPEVNRFVYLLHIDALALLVSVFSFWTMLRYLKAPSWQGIALMAICPALGYLTKQFLISWAVVMFVFLLLHNYRDIKRLALFSVLATICIALAVGGCYLLWGDPFIFWTFKVMGARKAITFSPGSRQISILRMLDHTLRAWPELIIGVIGGTLCLRYRRENTRRLGPLWVAWVALILSESFSSGAGWDTVYHFGPGVLIGTTWLLAALPVYWPGKPDTTNGMEFPRVVYFTRVLLAMAGVLTLMIALRVVPTGDRNAARYWGRMRQSPDVNRYLADIESEFNGVPPEKVLLDIGNWVYLRNSVLQKDRAISIADQPASGHYENMDVFVSRIRQRAYAKIMVHDLHSPFFIYDWYRWPRSSGVRQALLDNYQEVRTISAPEGKELLPQTAFTGPVSVLVPR